MTDPTPTADERIARLEARVAELERRARPAPDPSEVPLLGSGRRLTDAQVDAVWTLMGGDPTTAGLRDWQREMLAANLYDPTVSWSAAEIKRMREE